MTAYIDASDKISNETIAATWDYVWIKDCLGDHMRQWHPEEVTRL